MKKVISLFASILALSFCGLSVKAQLPTFSVGPQVGGFGIGAAASYGINSLLSVSAEIGFLPISTIDLEEDGVDYSLDPTITGGIIGLQLHPFRGKFSFGVGVVLGKYDLDGESGQLSQTVQIGDVEYTAQDVGTVLGRFRFEGPWPALLFGWRGAGLNFGLGIAFADNPVVELETTGLLSNDPTFQAELEKERRNVVDDLKISAFPVFRLGWQFGTGPR